MPRTLDGIRILAPESRELDLFAALLEKEGARVARQPLLRICDLEDRSGADRWIDDVLTGALDTLILLTGEGLQRLLALSESGNRRAGFVDALSRLRTIVRGPKPARALREIGLAPSLFATQPTTDGVIDALAGEDLRERRFGVQLYPGPGALRLVDWLRDRGAIAQPVTPYRYASEIDADKVAEIIRDLAEGRIDVVAFTSGPQIDRLVEVARDRGLSDQLRQGLARTLVASIGPLVADKLAALGVRPFAQPETNFHMKPLVRSIVAAYADRAARS